VARHLAVLRPALAATAAGAPRVAPVLAPALATIACSAVLTLAPAAAPAAQLAAVLVPAALAAALLRDALLRESRALVAAWRRPRRAAPAAALSAGERELD
jgi:hypothetical protein